MPSRKEVNQPLAVLLGTIVAAYQDKLTIDAEPVGAVTLPASIIHELNEELRMFLNKLTDTEVVIRANVRQTSGTVDVSVKAFVGGKERFTFNRTY